MRHVAAVAIKVSINWNILSYISCYESPVRRAWNAELVVSVVRLFVRPHVSTRELLGVSDEIWYGLYTAEAYPKLKLFNFLQSAIPT
jgi:hypothetical protein